MIIVFIVITIIILYVIYKINVFITLRNKLKQSESSIEVYLNQRFDLIPNLVEVVKGYAKYEESIFTKITEIRSIYQRNRNLENASNVNNEFNKLFAVYENMPDLKASTQFLELQRTLEKIENNLQAARRLYNGDVTLYNTAIKTFPNNIIAELFSFKEEKLFETEEFKKSNIKVDL